MEPRPPEVWDEVPRLPSVEIQREVEIKLAEREMTMEAGREAIERYRQRQPHAVMSLGRIARLLKIGIDFGRLASGLEIINPVPEKITYDYELTALKRNYGDETESIEDAGGDSVPPPTSALNPSTRHPMALVTLRKEFAAMLGVGGPELCVGSNPEPSL